MISRRIALKGLGISISLPLLEVMVPSTYANVKSPKTWRFLATKMPFGCYGPHFFPDEDDVGKNYKLSKTLSHLKDIKEDFTVFSNLSHKLKGGHSADHTFLSGIHKYKAKGLAEGCISIDQKVGEFTGVKTRYRSLCLWDGGPSFTRMSAQVETIKNTYQLFMLLFSEKLTPQYVKKMKALHERRESILDVVLESSKAMSKIISKRDKSTLDEYFTSIRGLEKSLASSRMWLTQPKPKVNYNANKLNSSDSTVDSILEDSTCYKNWYDLIFLAFQTDSTRSAVIGTSSKGAFASHIVRGDYHGLSHHGKRSEKIKMLTKVEAVHLCRWREFIQRLKESTTPDGKTMYDSTICLFGSGMGNGDRHTNIGLPILLAGGGFNHGQHINNKEEQFLSQLYLSILQKMQFPVKSFAGQSKGFIGLEGI